VYAYQYLVVDRNDHSTLDYNTPRLNKMVTEVHAAELPQNFSAKDLLNGRYIAFARAGSGMQAIQEGNNITIQHNAYKFPTGGTPLNMKDNTGDMVGTIEGSVLNPKSSTGPLVSYGTKGDSGSPLWGFDKELKRWVMIGNVAQYYGYDYIKNNYMVTQNNFLRQNELDDTAAALNIKSTKPIYWDNTESGKSRITSELNHADIEHKIRRIAYQIYETHLNEEEIFKFNVDPNSKIPTSMYSIIGNNGSGKTNFLKQIISFYHYQKGCAP